MKRSVVPSVRLVLLLATTGCAYYNGMYNAKRWSRAAERSERAGRTSEARERWQRAAIHAESLTARHPRSRWADDAMLVRGRAALHLELNTEAAALLTRAARQAGEPEQRLEALLLLGRANLALRRYADARSAFDSAVGSSSNQRRAEALLYRGGTLLAMGAPADALTDVNRSTHPRARVDRAGLD
ncbi:MAG: tetratricopeptide repeat protein, partial [Gemmatimonadota bacterium]